MEATRVTLGRDKLVYVILSQKSLKYPWGKSKIAYLGTTKKGVKRIAQSIASRAEEVLSLHGVRKCTVRILTCSRKRNVKTWMELEKALLSEFKQVFGDLPKCNRKGGKIAPLDRHHYFNADRLRTIIYSLG